jgi:hypothetical protein
VAVTTDRRGEEYDISSVIVNLFPNHNFGFLGTYSQAHPACREVRAEKLAAWMARMRD